MKDYFDHELAVNALRVVLAACADPRSPTSPTAAATSSAPTLPGPAALTIAGVYVGSIDPDTDPASYLRPDADGRYTLHFATRYSIAFDLKPAFAVPVNFELSYSWNEALSRCLRSALMPPCPSRRSAQRSTKAIVSRRRSSVVACGWRQNNRVENSHQPVRQRERGLQRFTSLRHAARFCSVFSTVCNQFRPGRHALSAPNYRTVMRRRWWAWDVVSETTAFAVAA